MKKILFTMLLFIGAAAVQAAIVNDSTVVATPTDSTEVDPIETAYKELTQSIDHIYNSSSFSQKKETKETLYAAAGEIKELIIQSYEVPVVVEEVYVPDPKVEAKKAEYAEYLEMYEEVRVDAEWLDEANAYFVKLVEDCINNPKPTELQIQHAKEAAEHLPSEYKLLKNRLKKKVG